MKKLSLGCLIACPFLGAVCVVVLDLLTTEHIIQNSPTVENSMGGGLLIVVLSLLRLVKVLK